ncbi:MAG: alpha/beta fold hydrolase [Candidatus Nanopelagicales bacterium]
MDSSWLDVHRPELPWAPRGLPGWLQTVPGWAARAASESRFAAEIADFEASTLCRPTGAARGLPPGDGRPVLVVPGFGFGDSSTLPLQWALHTAGYRVVRSGITLNVACSDRTVDALAEVARRTVDADDGRRLFVVGHSRGGMLARGLAARHPELVERVVSLGVPLNHEFAFYEIPAPLVGALKVIHSTDPELRARKCVTPECTCPYMAATKRPLPPGVELVSIYTKTDGIVDWRACVVPGARNIEVTGSHLGMGLKPATVRLVLEELAQPWPVATG